MPKVKRGRAPIRSMGSSDKRPRSSQMSMGRKATRVSYEAQEIVKDAPSRSEKMQANARAMSEIQSGMKPIRSSQKRGSPGGQAPAAWTPAELFQSGEQGAYYDPSDISTLWQDDAGTIPVTADGQTVGRMDDLSGNGNHLIEFEAAGPTYRVGGGKPYLEFVADVDSRLRTAAEGVGVANVGLAAVLGSAGTNWQGFVSNSSVGDVSVLLGQNATSAAFYTVPNVALSSAARTWVDGVNTNAYTHDVVGTYFVDGTDNTAPALATPQSLSVGSDRDIGRFPEMSFYALVTVGNSVAQVLSQADREQLEVWLASKLP